jgi:hypothetical protein
VSALFAWNVFNFQTMTLDSTLVIAVTYLGTTIAAILLPYRKPELYNASPIAKFKVAGIPLITIAGVIFGGFLVFLLVEWFFDPWLNTGGTPPGLYGISLANIPSVVYMLVMYGLATGIYLGFKAYRMKTGINLDKVHAEIPAE